MYSTLENNLFYPVLYLISYMLLMDIFVIPSFNTQKSTEGVCFTSFSLISADVKIRIDIFMIVRKLWKYIPRYMHSQEINILMNVQIRINILIFNQHDDQDNPTLQLKIAFNTPVSNRNTWTTPMPLQAVRHFLQYFCTRNSASEPLYLHWKIQWLHCKLNYFTWLY